MNRIMGGMRMHVVLFEHNPSADELKKLLLELTGLDLSFNEKIVGVLTIAHPARPKSIVNIEWFDKQPIRCIRVESESPRVNYIEGSVLYVLKQVGGVLENDFSLPCWVGKKWTDVWPSSPLARVVAWWNRSLPL